MVLIALYFIYDQTGKDIQSSSNKMTFRIDSTENDKQWDEVIFARRSPQIEKPKKPKEFLEKYPPQYYEMDLNRETKVKILLNFDIIQPRIDIPVKVLFEDPIGETISVSIQIEISGVIMGASMMKTGIDPEAIYKSNQFLFQGSVNCVEPNKGRGDKAVLKVIRSFRMPVDEKTDQFRIESYEVPVKIKLTKP